MYVAVKGGERAIDAAHAWRARSTVRSVQPSAASTTVTSTSPAPTPRSAPDKGGETVEVDAAYVERHLGDLARSTDLSRYVL